MDFIVLHFDIRAESASVMSVANNAAIDVGGTLWFLPPYLVDEPIGRWLSRSDARLFDIIPTSSTLVVMVGLLNRETALAGAWHR